MAHELQKLVDNSMGNIPVRCPWLLHSIQLAQILQVGTTALRAIKGLLSLIRSCSCAPRHASLEARTAARQRASLSSSKAVIAACIDADVGLLVTTAFEQER